MSQASVTVGNTKLGQLIGAWSLPAGESFTCPGETPACRVACYAKSGFFNMPSVKESHQKNLEMSKQPDFVEWMVAKLRSMCTGVVRIHVSGDYYNADYAASWRKIIQASPRIQFFSYTRSWRISKILPKLMSLQSLPNMSLWWSLDKDAYDAPYVSGIRRAYMAGSDDDAAQAPHDCDLVFRTNTRTVMKKGNGVFVCPPENGVKLKFKMTCSKCGVCWNQKTPRWEAALFDVDDVVDINA